MIKVIIFGLWETLGSKHFSASKALREHFGIQASQDFLEKYERSMQLEVWYNIERMAKNFLEAFEISPTQQNVSTVVGIIQKGIDQAELFTGMEELLKELQQNYQLAILSNTNNFEATVIDKWGIDKYFSKKFYSWSLKSLKPSRNNFHEVCKVFAVEPNNCLYIDNEDRSTHAAEEYGFKTIAFKNVSTLGMQLNLMKII
jgi:FMN phosphatase YigB (HAD superfamily)